MSRVRVLVGTRKGAFVLTSDGKRASSGTSAGRTSGAGRCTTSRVRRRSRIGSTPRSPAAGSGRSSSAPTTAARRWETVGNKFAYDGATGTHLWYDGTPHPWEFARVWHLEPSLTDPDTVYAGVEDAALFRSTDGGQTGRSCPGCASTPRRRSGSPARAGCACTRSCSIRAIPSESSSPSRRPACSAATTRGKTWQPINRGLRSEQIPDPDRRGRSLRAPHRHASRAARRAVHAEALGRHAQRRRRRVVARGQRQPADRLRLPDRRARARAGDDLRRADQERLGALSCRTASCACTAAAPAATSGRRSPTACRSATATSTCCATRWRSTRSIRAASTSAPPAARCTCRPTRGDNWAPIVRDLPSVVSVEVQTLP